MNPPYAYSGSHRRPNQAGLVRSTGHVDIAHRLVGKRSAKVNAHDLSGACVYVVSVCRVYVGGGDRERHLFMATSGNSEAVAVTFLHVQVGQRSIGRRHVGTSNVPKSCSKVLRQDRHHRLRAGGGVPEPTRLPPCLVHQRASLHCMPSTRMATRHCILLRVRATSMSSSTHPWPLDPSVRSLLPCPYIRLFRGKNGPHSSAVWVRWPGN